MALSPTPLATTSRSRTSATLPAAVEVSRQMRNTTGLPSGLSPLKQYRRPGGASRLAALLIAHLCPINSLFAPSDPGAARRRAVLLQRRQATSRTPLVEVYTLVA